MCISAVSGAVDGALNPTVRKNSPLVDLDPIEPPSLAHLPAGVKFMQNPLVPYTFDA